MRQVGSRAWHQEVRWGRLFRACMSEDVAAMFSCGNYAKGHHEDHGWSPLHVFAGPNNRESGMPGVQEDTKKSADTMRAIFFGLFGVRLGSNESLRVPKDEKGCWAT